MRTICKDDLLDIISDEAEDEGGYLLIRKSELLDKIDKFPDAFKWYSIKDGLPHRTERYEPESAGSYLCNVVIPSEDGGKYNTKIQELYYDGFSWSVQKGIVTHWTEMVEKPKEIVLKNI